MPSSMPSVLKNNFSKKLFSKIKSLVNNKIVCRYIKKSGVFDEELYLKNYPDVKNAGVCPVAHYVSHGWKEGRSPNPLFDTAWYLKTNSDIAALNINPYYHYIQCGWKEGRSPNPLFNVSWYLAVNKDVAESGCEPLWHYQTYGWKKGYSPSPLFDLPWYLETNNDVAINGCEPLQHYQKMGHKEGRFPNVLFNAACLDNILTKKYGLQVAQEVRSWLSLLKKIENENITESQHCCIINILKESLKSIIKSSYRQKTNNYYDISIIIPVHNHIVYTLVCIISLLSFVTNYSYEILIGDDTSTDGTKEFFTHLHPSIKVIHHLENLGFIRNCNKTAQYAKGEYVLFLNNDTIILPGALDALVSIFKTRKDAGLVGVKLINADGTLQEAGGIVWNDGSGWNYGRGGDVEGSSYNYVREVDYCSGACLLTTRNIWKQLNGFNESYSFAYYEDTDLAFRIREIGKKVYYQPLSEAIHHEGISHGQDLSNGLKKYQNINKEKFFQRWKERLQKDYHPQGTELVIARERAKKKKTILFIDHEIPTPDRDAGSKSILSYISFFLRKGFHVLLLGDNHQENQPYSDLFRNMGVEVLVGNKFSINWKQWLSQYGKYIDYAFLSRSHTSLRWIEPLRTYTSAKLLFYGVDLISRTRERAYYDTGLIEHKMISEEFKSYEDSVHALVDAIFYPSQIEVDFLSNKIEKEKIKKIPLYVYENKIEPVYYNAKKREGLLFMGGFRHPPNLDGITWFISEVFPKVLAVLPSLQLTIAGSYFPLELPCFLSKNIKIESNISDVRLKELINKSKLSIAPLRFGGGIKGKVVDSLRNGLPVITTKIGAEGLNEEGEHMVVVSLENFAEELLKLYTNNAILNKISAAGIKYIATNFSEEAMKKVISSYIPEIN